MAAVRQQRNLADDDDLRNGALDRAKPAAGATPGNDANHTAVEHRPRARNQALKAATVYRFFASLTFPCWPRACGAFFWRATGRGALQRRPARGPIARRLKVGGNAQQAPIFVAPTNELNGDGQTVRVKPGR
jgi:hypothetical protein